MTTMERTQQLTLERQWLESLQEDFWSARVTDDEMCNSLRKVHDKLNYVADPHTAVAMACAEKLGYDFTEEVSEGEMIPMVLVSTASPCKFQHAVEVALGKDGWKQWEDSSFPDRARETLEMTENEPYHYVQTEGAASLHEVQTQWKKSMLDIVQDNF